jgi:hypothetical protein
LKVKIRFKVSDLIKNIRPDRDKVTGCWRRLHNEELNNSANIIRMIRSRMRVTCVTISIKWSTLCYTCHRQKPLWKFNLPEALWVAVEVLILAHNLVVNFATVVMCLSSTLDAFCSNPTYRPHVIFRDFPQTFQ